MGRGAGEAALLALALAAGGAWAHGVENEAVPLAPGWQLGGALAAGWTNSGQAWPVARLDGVLLTGQTEADQRHMLRLQEATMNLGLRWAGVGAQWSVSAHDNGAPHTDVLRVEAAQTLAGGELRERLGRQTVSMGTVLDGAGRLDRFALRPLAQQAALLDGSWTDDGLEVQWRQPEEQGVRAVAWGVWRARAFPGGPQGPVAPSLKLEAGWGHTQAELFAAWLQPEGRGANALSSAVGGHSHGVPDCTLSVAKRVCFDGHTRVLGAAVANDGGLDGRLMLSLAGLVRQDRGQLYTTSSTVTQRGQVSGVWLDAVWRPQGVASLWQGAARLERLVPRQTLTGDNPGVVAAAAGLSQAPPVARQTVALGYAGWRPWGQDGLMLWAEAGRQQTQGASAPTWVGLRLLWQAPRAAQGHW